MTWVSLCALYVTFHSQNIVFIMMIFHFFLLSTLWYLIRKSIYRWNPNEKHVCDFSIEFKANTRIWNWLIVHWLCRQSKCVCETSFFMVLLATKTVKIAFILLGNIHKVPFVKKKERDCNNKFYNSAMDCMFSLYLVVFKIKATRYQVNDRVCVKLLWLPM